MNILNMIAVGILVFTTISNAVADDKSDNAKLLLGKWEVLKAEKELPVGTVIEFSKDGKMKITVKADGKEESVDAIYSVDGDKIVFTLQLGAKQEKKDPLTITKLSDKELVVKTRKGDFELKRLK